MGGILLRIALNQAPDAGPIHVGGPPTRGDENTLVPSVREYHGAWGLSPVKTRHKTRHIHTSSGLLVEIAKCHVCLPLAGVGVLITPTPQLLLLLLSNTLIKSLICSGYFRFIFFRGL